MGNNTMADRDGDNQKGGLLARIGEAIRPGKHKHGQGLGAAGRDGLLVEPAETSHEPHDTSPTGSDGQGARPGPWALWGRRDDMGDSADRLAAAVERLERQLQQQDSLQQQRNDSVVALVRSVREMTTVAQEQQDVLRNINKQLETLGFRAQQWTGTLETLPRVARDYGDKLASIERQLQADAEQDGTVLHAMGAVGAELGHLVRISDAQLKQFEAFGQFQREAAGQMESLWRQNRRARREQMVAAAVVVALMVVLIVQLWQG